MSTNINDAFVLNDHTWRKERDLQRVHADINEDGWRFKTRRTFFGETLVARDGYTSVATPMDKEDLIPKDDWDSHIARKDREKSWLYDLVNYADISCGDQNGTNYCHAFGIVQAMMDIRCLQGHPFTMLSAMSIGGPITNWRNRGAYPEDDLIQANEYGACPLKLTDGMHSFNHTKWNPLWRDERKFFRVPEWTDGLLPDGLAFDAMATAAMRNLPCYVGYKWWSHAFSGGYKVRREDDGSFSILQRNTWGSDYGTNGFFWMNGRKAVPDINMYILRSMVPTG